MYRNTNLIVSSQPGELMEGMRGRGDQGRSGGLVDQDFLDAVFVVLLCLVWYV